MGARFLRVLGFVAYGLLVVAAFLVAAYLAFSVFVRSGVTPVPKVTGLTRDEAANALADRGLVLRRVAAKGRYDDTVPAGHVLRQVPDARTLVKRGSGVDLVMSSGPQRIEVPSLAAKPFPTAQVALSAAGLTVGKTLIAFAAGQEPGSIIDQEPDAGAMVPPATPVDVLLAGTTPGRRYVMPDLVYRQYDPVRAFFEGERIRMGNVKFERYEGVAAGVILRQFPLPGHPLTRDDAVSLVVATAEGVS